MSQHTAEVDGAECGVCSSSSGPSKRKVDAECTQPLLRVVGTQPRKIQNIGMKRTRRWISTAWGAEAEATALLSIGRVAAPRVAQRLTDTSADNIMNENEMAPDRNGAAIRLACVVACLLWLDVQETAAI